MIEQVESGEAKLSPQRQRFPFILAILWAAVSGVIFVMLLRTPSGGSRNTYGAIAAAVGLIALFAYLRDSFLGPKRSTWSLLLLITCVLIVSIVVWNRLFHSYIRQSGYTFNNFREIYHTKHAPVYGRAERPLLGFVIWSAMGAVVTLGLVILFRRRLLEQHIPAWWFVLLQIGLTFCFALSDGTRQFKREPPQPLASTAPAQPRSVRLILHHYVERMPWQAGRMPHYPPGDILYRHLLGKLHLSDWRRIITFVLVGLTPPALAGLARELGLQRGAAQLGLLLFSTALTVLVFTRADFAVLSVPLTAASLWLLMRGARRGEWWVAVLLGIVYAAYTMFAFTSIVAGFMMALLIIGGLWTGNIKLAPAVKTVAVSALVFFAIFLGIYWWSGFSIYECFQVARANETGEHGSGFDDPRRYLLRSTGHVLAYLVSCGFAMAGFALMSLRGRPSRLENPMLGVAALALAATILVAGFGGSFHGETERVWLFFTPLLAVVAGAEWHRRTAKEGRGLLIGVAAVMLLGNCALELLYKHQSRSLRRESGPQAVQMPEATDSD